MCALQRVSFVFAAATMVALSGATGFGADLSSVDVGGANGKWESLPGMVRLFRSGGGVEWVPGARVADPTDPTKDRTVRWWENGECDNQLLHVSHSIDIPELQYDVRTADDFLLRAGCWYHIHTVTVMMATTSEAPQFGLEFYTDCNGQPGEALDLTGELDGSPFDGSRFSEYEIELTGVGTDAFEGLFFYKVTFLVDGFVDGYRRLWLSPFGEGLGEYYWVSANDGKIQGRKGQYLDIFGDWNEIDAPCLTCGNYCTDFCFEIDGQECKVLKDNSHYAVEMGPAMHGPPNIAGHGPLFFYGAADDFQVPPGGDLEICKLQIWVASNCVQQIEAALLEGECERPVGDPIPLGPPQEIRNVTALDGVPSHRGLPVYRVTWASNSNLPDLQGGRSYWIQVGFYGSTSSAARGYWLFRAEDECDGINIDPARFRYANRGYPQFTPYEIVHNVNRRVDHAFKLWTNPKPVECPEEEPDTGSPGLAPTEKLRGAHLAFPSGR